MEDKEDAKMEPADQTRPSRSWNGWDIFFIVAPLICIILGPFGALSYLCGRFHFYLLDSCMFSFFTGCFIIFCIVYGFDRLSMYGKNYTPKKRFLVTVEIVIPIVCMLSCIAPFVIHFETFFCPACKPYMYGIRDRVSNNADISAIRAWLKTLDEEDLDYYRKHPDYFRSHYDELPETIKAIGGSISFSIDKNGNAVLQCSFGRTFENCSVVIGTEDMDVSSLDNLPLSGYRMFVELGFYIVAW